MESHETLIMLPTNINGGWAHENVTTTLLFPRNDISLGTFSRSRRTISTDIWSVQINADKTITVFDQSGSLQETIIGEDPSNVDIAFDQNDRYTITWEEPGNKIYILWFDPVRVDYTTTLIAEGNNPCCSIDDYRSIYIPDSDVFIFYQREDSVFYRMQRDRYLVEYEVSHTLQDIKLETCGMGTNLRLTLRVTSIDGIVLCAGQTPIKIGTNYVGLYWGEIPWAKSSSNTEI